MTIEQEIEQGLRRIIANIKPQAVAAVSSGRLDRHCELMREYRAQGMCLRDASSKAYRVMIAEEKRK